ncbi:MAG: hypothetical protein HYW78_04015 [Parcubacteria group bacterium]|nr:hypothetical protein [Parcubacteria group bacterium]
MDKNSVVQSLIGLTEEEAFERLHVNGLQGIIKKRDGVSLITDQGLFVNRINLIIVNGEVTGAYPDN